MNILIKKELDSVKKIVLPEFSDTDLNISIPKNLSEKKEPVDIFKSVETVKDYILNGSYKIRLMNYIVHPYNGFDLHKQWNNNIVPQEYVYNIRVIRVMGKMIKIDGIGCEQGTRWCGWIPKISAEILEVL